MDVFIYALSDPRTNEIRYVGKTVDINRRITSHLSSSSKRNTYKDNWIQSLLSIGLKPIVDVLESFYDDDGFKWQEAERWWISYLKYIGCNLTNLDNGGHSGVNVHSQITRDKMRLSQSLNKTRPKRTEEHCRRISESKKGIIIPMETRLKMSASQKGRKHSEETKLKIKKAIMASGHIKIATAAAAKLIKGMNLPPEWRKKMSESHKLRHEKRKLVYTAIR